MQDRSAGTGVTRDPVVSPMCAWGTEAQRVAVTSPRSPYFGGPRAAARQAAGLSSTRSPASLPYPVLWKVGGWLRMWGRWGIHGEIRQIPMVLLEGVPA